MRSLQQPIVVVDIETTGLSPVHSRIIDIACIRLEQGQETKRFVSLVDPEQSLPLSIQALTGISPDHLTGAPPFHQIADEIEAILEGAIFVAHNARFDYSFIKAEMERMGRRFQKKTLCTVKLSRSLYPKEARHDLSSIIQRFSLTCEARHRALGDTEALVQFLERIEATFSLTEIEQVLTRELKKTTIPPQLDSAMIAALPDSPGVYTFFGKDGELLYIGKSKHIRTRVMSHFANTHRESKELRLFQETTNIEYEETVSELGASLLELYKIKNESPLLNRLSRRTRSLFVLKKKINEAGYFTFALESMTTITAADFPSIYGIFRNRNAARETLRTLCDTHGFCPRLMGLEKGEGACFSAQLEKCSGACHQKPDVKAYNLLLETTLQERKIALWPAKGSKTLRFYNEETGQAEIFVIDQWMLKKALKYESDEPTNFLPSSDEKTFFDYDVYKVLMSHLLPRFQ